MQLSSLKDGLELSLQARAHRSAPALEDEKYEDVGLAAEIFTRHKNSTQPHSQQLVAILQAVLEVLKAEGLQPTPTALFAALMSSLEKPETLLNDEVRRSGAAA